MSSLEERLKANCLHDVSGFCGCIFHETANELTRLKSELAGYAVLQGMVQEYGLSVLADISTLDQENRQMRARNERLEGELIAWQVAHATAEKELAALKAELAAISKALDSPHTDLSMTMVEVIQALKAQSEPYAWCHTGSSRLWDETDAKMEAKHCGGTCVAFPVFTHPFPADNTVIRHLQDPLNYAAIELYEKALKSSWPRGAKGKAFDFWTAARTAVSKNVADQESTDKEKRSPAPADKAQQAEEPVAKYYGPEFTRYCIEWLNGPLPEGTLLYTRRSPADKDAERLDLLVDLFDKHLIPLSLHELRMQFERIKAGKLPVIRKATRKEGK
jgi:hypothetical protein